MDDVRTGARFRAIRLRLAWRQVDLAARAGVSQPAVSRVERGQFDGLTLRTIRRVAGALDAEFTNQLRWRGGDLDRLVDEGHARLLGRLAVILGADRWQVRIEVSYSVYGERGSIDLLARHPATGTVLVVEVKTDLVSVEETLRKHDEKARLAKRISAEQLGWRPDVIGRLLVLPSTATQRRRVARHAAVLDAAYPLRGVALRHWLAGPDHDASGLLFVDQGSRGGQRGGLSRKRVRARSKSPEQLRPSGGSYGPRGAPGGDARN
jgi:transcriptional regulator with XRE-family HTH domain